MKAENRDIDVAQDDALPSVEMTMRFLALCDRYGSHESVVAGVGAGPAGWSAGRVRSVWIRGQRSTTKTTTTGPASAAIVPSLNSGGRTHGFHAFGVVTRAWP